MKLNGCDIHVSERPGVLARVGAPERELAVRVPGVRHGGERDADLPRADQALLKRVVGDRRDALGGMGKQCACESGRDERRAKGCTNENIYSSLPQVRSVGPMLYRLPSAAATHVSASKASSHPTIPSAPEPLNPLVTMAPPKP